MVALAATIGVLVCFEAGILRVRPSGMSKETYDAGVDAVEVAERYLNGEVGGTDAYEQIDHLDTIAQTHSSKDGPDLEVRTSMRALRGKFRHKTNRARATGTYTESNDEVIEAVNDLRDVLGLSS